MSEINKEIICFEFQQASELTEAEKKAQAAFEALPTDRIPEEHLETALEFMNDLITSTEGEVPDPLTDQVFRTRDALCEVLN